jgi:hypothetical protein
MSIYVLLFTRFGLSIIYILLYYIINLYIIIIIVNVCHVNIFLGRPRLF